MGKRSIKLPSKILLQQLILKKPFRMAFENIFSKIEIAGLNKTAMY